MVYRVLRTPPRAICRWDTVQYIDVTSPITVGVLAYHISGIDRIEFVSRGNNTLGQPFEKEEVVTSESWNNQWTNPIWDYNITFDPSEWQDGKVVITATAFPIYGQPIEQTLTLFANYYGTLPSGKTVYVAANSGSDTNDGLTKNTPVKTIKKAVQILASDTGAPDSVQAAIIELIETGEYKEYVAPSWPNLDMPSYERWITVKASDSLMDESVIISADDGNPYPYNNDFTYRIYRARFYRIKFDWAKLLRIYTSNAVWLDHCWISSSRGPLFYDDYTSGGGNEDPNAEQRLVLEFVRSPWDTYSELDVPQTFSTNTYLHDCVWGTQTLHFQRDCLWKNGYCDVASQTYCAINLFVDNVQNGPNSRYPHTDMMQYWVAGDRDTDPNYTPTNARNIVVYGLKSVNNDSQQFLLNGGYVWDYAVVNSVLAAKESAKANSLINQWDTYVRHALIYHVTQLYKRTLFRDRYNSNWTDHMYYGDYVRFLNCSFYEFYSETNSEEWYNDPQVWSAENSCLFLTGNIQLGTGSIIADPKYNDYIYDFTPQPGSPLIGLGKPIAGMSLPAEEVGDLNNPNAGAWASMAAWNPLSQATNRIFFNHKSVILAG